MVSPEYIIFPIITVFAIALTVLAVLAYKKSKKNNMLFLSVFFLLFMIKGLMISIDLFYDYTAIYWMFILGGILDAFALLLLYITTLKE